MPPRKAKRRAAEEFFYLDNNHDRQDADLHQPILDGGDHETATAIGKAVMKRLGLSDEAIEKLTNGATK
jgi:hypothetical protein